MIKQKSIVIPCPRGSKICFNAFQTCLGKIRAKNAGGYMKHSIGKQSAKQGGVQRFFFVFFARRFPRLTAGDSAI
ncbi:MAG: hypothetical protein LBI94_01680 [Treponema sp.]|nr:hypothetical protein [Treponema sp.]